MKVDIKSSELTAQEANVQELEELVQLYKDGTLPYDEEDVKKLEDKIAFEKQKIEQMYQYLLMPRTRKLFFKVVRFIMWIRKITKRFRK